MSRRRIEWLPYTLTVLLMLASLVATPMRAQSTAPRTNGDTLSASARWNADSYLSSRAELRVELTRTLDAARERIGLVVDGIDVSALLVVEGHTVSFTPERLRLPAGETEAVAYLVHDNGAWEEIMRAPLRVRTRAGLDQAALRPSVELSTTGPVARGDPSDVGPVVRPTYQDATLRLGLDGNLLRGAWRVITHANALAVTEQSQRLRFGELQQRAPQLDLADYTVQATRGSLALALGHQSVGQHRLLVSGFGSRGLGGAVRLGPIASLEASVLNGTSIAGWGNPLGVSDPRHRVASAGLSLELVPSRPGALHVHLAGLDGSLLPRTGFLQGAATDAELSQGGGVRVVMSDIDQRIRFEGGFARSRFNNPIDPLLSAGEDIVPVRAETRTARFGELNVDLLRSIRLAPALPASLAVTARHERIDPLYRSVAAFVQPDRDAAGVDVVGALGALSVRAGLGASNDNLQRIPSVLTTRTRQQSLAAALPLGARCTGKICPWPNVSYARERSRQFGDDVPVNGEFDPSHIPDQSSLNQTATLGWTVRSVAIEYRWNGSYQDNRQPGRENADFRTSVNALTVAGGRIGWVDVGVDASRERQLNEEIDATQQVDRIGATLRAQPWRATEVLAVVSHAWGRQPAESLRTRNVEYQFELSRGFDLYRRYDGGTQARAWLRFARTRAAVLPLQTLPLLDARISWTLVAGGSFRLY